LSFKRRLKKKFPKSFVKASAKKTEEKWTKQKALLIINEAAAEVAREDRQAVRIKANQTKKPSIPKTRMVSTNEKNNDNN